MNSQNTSRSPLPWILLLSAAISTFLLWLIYFKPLTGEPDWVTNLPAANALFNGLSAICLVGGIWNIRRQRRSTHIRFMCAATAFSALFLLSYIVYHNFHGDTPFRGLGLVRPIYFFILISHVLLSIVALPMVLTTLYYAASKRYVTHRKIARFTFPVWLYVSITGVVVFFFLKVYSS